MWTDALDRRKLVRIGAGVLAGALAPIPRGLAQEAYPSRPVRLVVPYAPGGVVDVVARHWADKAKPLLGTVVVENLAGGGGTVGAAGVKRSSPDGYSLLFGETSCLVIAPHLMAQAPYDPAQDFSPAAIVATSSTSIVVHPSVPVSRLEEFVVYAKENQGKLSYASAGAGTVTHLAGELFKQLIGAPGITHIPYRGAGPALVDVLAGQVPMTTPNITSQILDMHKAGRLRILAVCAPTRLKAVPDIPAAIETLPGLVMQLTSAVVAPAATPDPILSQLSRVTAQIQKDPEFERILASSGLEGASDPTPARAKAFFTSERARLIPIMKAAGLQPA